MLREAYSEKWEKSYLAFPEPETVNELVLWRGNYSGDHQDPLDQEKNVIHGDHSDVSVILNLFSIRLNSSKYCDIEIKKKHFK